MMVDEIKGMKWSNFYETKDGMVEPTCEKFHEWKQAGKPVKYVRCDNGGENKALENRLRSADWKLAVKFEWTARNALQRGLRQLLGTN